METQLLFLTQNDDPRLLPSRRGNQLNGNPSGQTTLILDEESPLSQGKPIEWKPAQQSAYYLGCSLPPLSQGKPIEWKPGNIPDRSAFIAELPSRRGNQLNGNIMILLKNRVGKYDRSPLSQGKPIEWKPGWLSRVLRSPR